MVRFGATNELRCFAWLAAIFAVMPGCQPDEVARTQIMLVVDSDLSVPSELDEIEMRVTGPSGDERVAVARLAEEPLPRSLALVHTEGPLTPLSVQIWGKTSGQPVVERRASLSFVEGRTLVLPMHLVRSCALAACGEQQTCAEQGCRDIAIDPQTLAPWSGTEPTLGGLNSQADASVPDPDSGTLDGGELEDASREDARVTSDGGRVDGAADGGAPDARTDSATADAAGPDAAMCQPDPDFERDEQNCGRCGTVCSGANRWCCRGVCSRTCN